MLLRRGLPGPGDGHDHLCLHQQQRGGTAGPEDPHRGAGPAGAGLAVLGHVERPGEPPGGPHPGGGEPAGGALPRGGLAGLDLCRVAGHGPVVARPAPVRRLFGPAGLSPHPLPRDWYEDVLRTAELAQSAIAAKKEGSMEAVPGKVRVGAHRHERGLGGLGLLLQAQDRKPPGRVAAAAAHHPDLRGGPDRLRLLHAGGGIIPVFALAVYLQLFTAGTSRINRELYKPFVYLVPEPPLPSSSSACGSSSPPPWRRRWWSLCRWG